MHVTPELPTANTGTHALICESLTCLHFCRQRRIEPHSAISRLTIHATMNQKGRIPASLMCASNIMSTCLHMLVIPEKASASAFFATCLLSNVCCCSCVIICNKICACLSRDLFVMFGLMAGSVFAWPLFSPGLFSVSVQYPRTSQKNDALAKLFACILGGWYACIERCSSHISRRICIQACKLLNASSSCRCVVYVCLCVCAYGCVRVEIPNICVEAPQKLLQVHVSHASTLESKSTLWMSLGFGLGLLTTKASIGHKS